MVNLLRGKGIAVSQMGNAPRAVGVGGDIDTLKGNSGGFVGPDGVNNVNVIGDGTTIDVVGNPGTNTLTISATGDVAVDFVADDTNTATPALNILNLLGGDNINTSVPVPGGDTLEVNLNTSIIQPNTNASGTEGLYSLGVDRFMHNYGTDNTFLGKNAGNLTLTTGSGNAGIGTSVFLALTTGIGNFAGGALALTALTTGTGNTIIGAQAAKNLTTGNTNTIVGAGSGVNYLTESNNVLIFNGGTIGDSGVIRIGFAGTQTKAFVSGIYNITPAVATTQVAIIDSAGQLGSSRGNNGQIIIGSTGGGTGSPAWANITSNDDTVTITNGANTIDLAAVGGTKFYSEVTNDATPTALFATIITDNSITTFNATVSAIKSDYSAALYGVAVVGARRLGGGAILVGTPNITFSTDSPAIPKPSLTAGVSGNYLLLYVTGVAAEDWTWEAKIFTVEVY